MAQATRKFRRRRAAPARRFAAKQGTASAVPRPDPRLDPFRASKGGGREDACFPEPTTGA